MNGGLLRGNLPQLFVGVLAMVCLTILVALHDIAGEVAVPILSALAGGGLGHMNGYRQATKANGTS